MVEDRDTILELTGKIQELQNEINCMNDSRVLQDAESVRSGQSHVASQPVFFPSHPDPGGVLSRSLGVPSRKTVRGVVDQFVRWFLGGTFRPRTDENDRCRHIFRESNKVADTHADWLMDNGDSGPGAQWMAPDLHDKMQKSRHIVLSFRWDQKEEWTWCGCLDSMATG